MKIESITKYLLNAAYFVGVLLIALIISTQALARRVNTYEATKKPLFFSVEKEQVEVTNSITGRVDYVAVTTGQHVSKGDLLVRLVDDTLGQKLNSLESFAESNLSAKTELEVLKAKSSEYEIRAARDGVIYRIDAVEGSYLNTNSSILTLFADSNVKVVGILDQAQYAEIQNNRSLDVYSPRFEQVYNVSFEGVGRVVEPTEGSKDANYEVKFKFTDSNEGPAFIDGERLEVISSNGDEEVMHPSMKLTKMWNTLILGK
ncbi:MAG: HlyD family efflux transporter periplasmic adaptor subunit [Undibacterium sp.]